jgi:hypothetical protein
MGQRRITAANQLAPIQEIAVNPFASYNSSNVNMLTRAVTGYSDQNVVIRGLDISGTPINDTELSTTIVDDDFSTLNVNWTLTDLEYQSGDQNLKAAHISTLSEFCELKRSDISFTKYVWYKITFSLKNIKVIYNPSLGDVATENQGTPLRVNLILGSVVKTWEYPAQQDFSIYVQAEQLTTDFRISVQFEKTNQFMSDYCLIDDILVKELSRKGGNIDPITELLSDETKLTAPYLRPHMFCEITSGVAVKDEAVVSAVGIDPENQPIITLEYGNINSWIKRNPYTSASFTEEKTYVYTGEGILYDDGDPDHLYDYTKGSDVQWAYIVLYYNFLKNPQPNISYYGIIRPSDLSDPIYGEDYLVLAKIRFIKFNVVDAIIYYPYRKDVARINAKNGDYFLSNLKDWRGIRPDNVAQALDILAARTSFPLTKLSPEYPNTIFSFNSENNKVHINTKFDYELSSTEGYNHSYYEVTTPEDDIQQVDILMRIFIPENFNEFTGFNLWIKTDSEQASSSSALSSSPIIDFWGIDSEGTIFSTDQYEVQSEGVWQQITVLFEEGISIIDNTWVTVAIRCSVAYYQKCLIGEMELTLS